AYNVKDMEAYASSITEPMDYMKDFKYLSPDQVPWGRLLPKAYNNARNKLEYDGKYHIIIKVNNEYFICDLNSRLCYMHDSYDVSKCPDGYSLIEIDYRYLFGLITGIYHWNNAEVGSQYMTTRVPDVYNRSVQRFLNFFVV
ncbi:MAG: hypothetical protein QQN63_11560, partial [Nitrosopumilus sp.]